MARGAIHSLSPKPTLLAPNGFSRPRLTRPAALMRKPAISLPWIAPPSLSRGYRPVPRLIRAVEESDKVEGSGSNSDYVHLFTWMQPLLQFAGTNFLPLALVSAICLGLVNPSPGCLAHRYSLTKFCTFGIFFISGFYLRSSEISAAVEAWPAGIWGLVSILVFTPFFAKFMLQIHLVPQEFVTGLAIFCCMPTTLSSGSAMTRLAGGNFSLALAMTVISNLLGIMIVPFSLSKFLGAGAGVSIPRIQLFKSLISTLLVPLIFGKILRESFKSVSEFVDINRRIFSMISALLISLVPWIQVSKSRSLLLTVRPETFAIVVGIGILLHLALLALNTLALQGLSIVSGGSHSVFSKEENARAVIIVASQKTLPVMVAVADQLGGALGEPGLLVIPCVASHIIQIIIDSVLVNSWIRKDQLSGKVKEA